MRWLTFFIFAYLVIGVQLGIGQMLSYAGATPNLVLIAAIFMSAGATRGDGVIAAFLLGLMQDLVSASPMGLYALCYGLTALAVVQARQVTTPDHPLANMLLTLAGGVITAIVVWLQHWFRPPGGAPTNVNGVVLSPFGISFGALLLSAIYSATLALPLLWGMGKLKPIFGFRMHRTRW